MTDRPLVNRKLTVWLANIVAMRGVAFVYWLMQSIPLVSAASWRAMEKWR